MKALLCVLAAIVVLFLAYCFATGHNPMEIIQGFQNTIKAAGLLVSLR